MYDISIIMPAIRTHKWDDMYDSILKSCKQHTFELILCGPFPLTEKLNKLSNVKWIQDYGSPSRCTNIALLEAKSKLCAHLVDDALFTENSLDDAIEQYDAFCTYKDVINLRYTEDHGHRGNFHLFGIEYFTAGTHPIYHLPGIPRNLFIAPHHIINTDYLKSLGGYDCINYEYQNHNLSDLMFRIQYDGGKIYHSHNIVSNCDWIIGGEHQPVGDAFDLNDTPRFREMFSTVDAIQQRFGKVNLDDWKNSPKIWKRRFGQFGDELPKKFEELKY